MSRDAAPTLPDRVAKHVAAFNEAVSSGAWDAFADRFAPNATMAFHGVPAPPAVGRDAIRAAYDVPG